MGGAREREEMRQWVRGEFEKWRHTTDEVSRATDEENYTFAAACSTFFLA